MRGFTFDSLGVALTMRTNSTGQNSMQTLTEDASVLQRWAALALVAAMC